MKSIKKANESGPKFKKNSLIIFYKFKQNNQKYETTSIEVLGVVLEAVTQ